MRSHFKCIIVGGGAAACMAGIYLSRGGVDFAIFCDVIGGQIRLTDSVENYLCVNNASGLEMANLMKEQLDKNKCLIFRKLVHKVERVGDVIHVHTAKDVYTCEVCLVASGANPKTLGLPNDEELWNSVVFTCALCDGDLFHNGSVIVLGGGNKGAEEAIYLSAICKSVIWMHRRDVFRAERVLVDKAKSIPNISIITSDTIDKIDITQDNKASVLTQRGKSLLVDAIFLAIGSVPNSHIVSVAKDSSGTILRNDKMQTSDPGIFTAGEVSDHVYRQLSTSVGFGAMAAIEIMRFIAR